MKKGMVSFVLSGFMVLTLATFSFAMEKNHAGDGKITGEVTHVEGDMYTVKDDHGKEHTLHVDKTTKKDGDIAVGTHVEAEATSSGHAKSISAHKEEAKH